MNKWTNFACALTAALALAACSGSRDSDGSHAAPTAGTAAKGTVPRPAANADENSWGLYLADQGKVQAEDIVMRPFIYVIPAMDTDMADERRKSQTESIVQGAGSILIPGSLLILGGPDAGMTGAFVEKLGPELKPDSLKGVTVLVVSHVSQKDALAKAFATAGAHVRVISM